MSELDTSLRELRDELHAAIPVPDVDGVASRARTRRRTQLGAIIAVVVVALAVPVLRFFATSVQPAAPVRPEHSYVVDFADADHGYALVTACPKDRQGCTFTLRATTDGGDTWERRTLPKVNSFTTELYVLGPDQVMIERSYRRFYTSDAGRTWLELRDKFNPVQQEMPLRPGALMTGSCMSQPASVDECSDLGTIEPGVGTFRVLPTQPPLNLKWAGSVATAGGRWWTTGRNVTTGKWSVSVSSDNGQSWATSELAMVGVPSTDRWSLIERNGVMYVTANDARSLLGVWRSTDDGRTWTRTWFKSAQASVPTLVGSPVAAGDGTLVLSDGTSTYVSTDQGRSFTRTGDRPGGVVTWTRAGYLRSDGADFALSTDGLRWRTFTIR